MGEFDPVRRTLPSCFGCSYTPDWWYAGRSVGFKYAEAYKNGIDEATIPRTEPDSLAGYYQELTLEDVYNVTNEEMDDLGTETVTTVYSRTGDSVIDHLPDEITVDITDARSPGLIYNFDHSTLSGAGAISDADLYDGLRGFIDAAAWTASLNPGAGFLPTGSGYLAVTGAGSAWGRQLCYAPTVGNYAPTVGNFGPGGTNPKDGMTLNAWVDVYIYDALTEETTIERSSFDLVFDQSTGYFTEPGELLTTGTLPFNNILPFESNRFYGPVGSGQRFNLLNMVG